ncbi:FBP domain-containing protein [Rhodococcus triatomae]|uniref:FBP C-terminal treble-clef zinc-finger n=1 Tax=Rhodococcus triatomae TaxID=300028 RepID=A0A1G8M2Y6_9NOCA|nr:FBP domain-containing protein [Rhodococcus triatomae]QNG18208.1 FBP domain-containing protein [Rhodococcus triatomae]QNG22121.1 FBP domain-containing protein [Rhodococcus triatomae]SDI62291.1 FBP C-terminal treble-clef zinc-finger [Rhodococcus triatomae]
MDAVTTAEIAGAFRNSSRSKVRSVTYPAGLEATAWEELDFLGWIDPKSPRRAYLVAPTGSGLVAIEMRVSEGGGARASASMCTLCRSVHRRGGTALFSATKVGPAGRAGNSAGTYICTDLNCSLYVRGIRTLPGTQPEKSVPVPDRIDGLVHRLTSFLSVVGAA